MNPRPVTVNDYYELKQFTELSDKRMELVQSIHESKDLHETEALLIEYGECVIKLEKLATHSVTVYDELDENGKRLYEQWAREVNNEAVNIQMRVGA